MDKRKKQPEAASGHAQTSENEALLGHAKPSASAALPSHAQPSVNAASGHLQTDDQEIPERAKDVGHDEAAAAFAASSLVAVPPAASEARSDANEEHAENLAAVDHETALAEFDHYKSLDEELAGDRQLEDLAQLEGTTDAAPSDGDTSSLAPPKERRLASMRLEAKVEAIVFASQKPLKPLEVLDVLADPTISVDDVQATLDQLVEFYEDRFGGFRLHHLKRLGYQFQTSESAGPIMERMFASRPRPISRAALETLSIIAYRQPVTRAEVEFIRGVDAGSIFKTLLERELIKCVGRKEIVGRPMLFGTTDQFLTVFNLSSIKDLPPLESFQPSREMVQDATRRIESQDELVDVEEYIADHNRAEYEGDEPELVGDDGEDAPIPLAQDLADAAEAEEGAGRLIGATAALIPPSADTSEPLTTDEASVLSELEHGTKDSEVVSAAGPGIEAGSRDLD